MCDIATAMNIQMCVNEYMRACLFEHKSMIEYEFKKVGGEITFSL